LEITEIEDEGESTCDKQPAAGKIFDAAALIWQDKRAAIAVTVDNLGDGFRPALRNGRLAYTKRA
jgi:hypothetical protein